MHQTSFDHSPGGAFENSPAFQRRAVSAANAVPKGRLNSSWRYQAVPSGLMISIAEPPALKGMLPKSEGARVCDPQQRDLAG